MIQRFAILFILLLVPPLALAQSGPHWPYGYTPSAEAWEAAWENKVDYSSNAVYLNPCTQTRSGLVPTPPNDPAKFLNGQCIWAIPPSSGLFIPNSVLIGGNGTSLTTPSAASATAFLNAFIGDSGNGGVKGLVPAPSIGDAAAGKVLGAGGGWVTPQSVPTAANPTATIGIAPVNGIALTYARSDSSPAIPQCSSSTFGACKVDGSTITASRGVISSVGGGGSTVDWVSITDSSKNGGHTVDPTGSADSTLGIQAAIDYAFANNLSAVYCPAGNYKTSNTIWLDPPNNMRATTWTGTGYISGTTLTISTTTSGTLGGVGSYISGGGVTPATIISAGTTSPYTVNNSQTIGSSGAHVALSATTPSVPSQAQFTMAFFGDPASGAVHLSGCRIKPTNNNYVAFMVGSGQSMRASDFSVSGPANAYRSLNSPLGIGIGIAGGSGGSSGSLIENTYVNNFYTLYSADANGACCLSDSNTFRKVGGDSGYVGITLPGSQSYINDIVEPYFDRVTIAIDSEFAHEVNVFGGNLSAISGVSGSFGLSSISGFFQGVGCNPPHEGGWCFTAVVASPDGYVGTSVYNAYTILTAHFGLIPLDLVAWDAGTNTATFGMWLPWLYANYGVTSAFSSHLSSDIIASVSTLYAAERVDVAKGMSITLDGTHVENPQACTTLLEPKDVWGGMGANKIKDVFFNYDPSGIVGTSFTLAQKYCQEAYPFIGGNTDAFNSTNPSIRLEGGSWGWASQPLLIALNPTRMTISGANLGANYGVIGSGGLYTGPRFNMQVYNSNGDAYGQLGGVNQLGTTARGMGRWDNDYFLPGAPAAYLLEAFLQASEMATDFCGYEPCPDRTPNLSPTFYALVSGALGGLGTYPPIACRTVFKSLDWNTTTPAGSKLWLRSASCPGWSWGQDLTDALVGETVTYAGALDSAVLYLDAKSLAWMFPGLGITLGSDKYVVTGVFPYLGYVTVISAASSAGGPLSTDYSCSSSCTIGQAPFAWTAY